MGTLGLQSAPDDWSDLSSPWSFKAILEILNLLHGFEVLSDFAKDMAVDLEQMTCRRISRSHDSSPLVGIFC